MKARLNDDSRGKLVRDAMQGSLIGIVPEMTVRELIHVLLENSIAGAAVLDQRGKAIGVVSMTDVLRLAVRDADLPGARLIGEPSFDACQVRDIMTPIAFTLSPADTLATAVSFLLRGRIHRAIVSEHGVLQGIITPFDVLQALDWEDDRMK